MPNIIDPDPALDAQSSSPHDDKNADAVACPAPTYSPSTFPSVMVAIQPVGGLGARMRCIAAYSVLAGFFRVPLHVCWVPGAGFEAIAIDALFAAVPPHTLWMDAAQWATLRKLNDRTVHLDKHISYLLRDFKYTDIRLDLFFRSRRGYRLTAECRRDLFPMYGATLLRYIPAYRAAFAAALSAFVPHGAVMTRVAEEVTLWRKRGYAEVLGVHIRRNDAVQLPWGRRYTATTEDEMCARVDVFLGVRVNGQGEEETFTARAAEQLLPARAVFIATDDPDVYSRLTARYGHLAQVRVHPWKRFRQQRAHSKQGQRKALVDLWTLGCCDAVVPTPVSACSEVAGMLLQTKAARDQVEKRRLEEPDEAKETAGGDNGGDERSRPAAFWTFDDETEPAYVTEAREAAVRRAEATQRDVDAAQAAAEELATTARKAVALATRAAQERRATIREATRACAGAATAAARAAADLDVKLRHVAWTCRGWPIRAVVVRKRVFGPFGAASN